MPEVPGDLITPSPKNATEKPDQKLQGKEEKKFNKEQDDQSNHQK